MAGALAPSQDSVVPLPPLVVSRFLLRGRDSAFWGLTKTGTDGTLYTYGSTDRREPAVTLVTHDGKQHTLDVTDHALQQILSKGFEADDVLSTLRQPRKIYASKSHPWQHRIVGDAGICLVGEFRPGRFVLITAYHDSVLTPPRPDQLSSPEGRRYAERYHAGLGRG